MKKFELALIALGILGITIFALMVAVYPPKGHVNVDVPVSSDDSNNGTGISQNWTDTTRDHVIYIAQSDPVVQKILGSSDNVSGPAYVPPGKTDVFLYDKERYAGVIFNASARPNFAAAGTPISLTIVVDVYTMREMAVLYRGMAPFMYSWVIIPPENGIYEMMGHWYTISPPDYKEIPEISSSIGSLNATPADAMLCPVIVDEENFHRFLNGSAYEVPDLIDPDTGKNIRLDGTIPVSAGLKSSYILPPERQPHNKNARWSTWYYAILLNKETDKGIKVVFTTPKPVIYEY